MATLQEIRNQYPQYNDLSNRELLDGIRNKYYPDIPKEQFYSKALGAPDINIESPSEVQGRAVRGALRQAASTIPLVGGFVDDIEAGVRAIGDTTREEELAKIREEQEKYRQDLDIAGVGGVSKGAEILGGIGAGIGGLSALGKAVGKIAPSVSKAAQTAKGQVALGSGLGAVEGAGFGDEEAGAGAAIGGIVGGAVPIIGRGVARALGKTEKFAGKPITELASEDEGVSTILKGVDASPNLAKEIRPIVDEALENTEQRVQGQVLKALDLKSVDEIAAPARKEYSDFINRVGKEELPIEEVNKLYDRENVARIARQFVANNPEYRNTPQNSIEFLQAIKSRAAERGRSASSDAPDWREASKAIKNTIDDNFSGFKELNKTFAKAIEAEDLASRITNLNLQETSNVANSILKGQNKRDIAKSFGKEKANKLFEVLRRESDVRDNLKSISTKARNRAQDRGSLNVLLGGENKFRNLASGVPLGIGLYNPALAVGLGAADIGSRVISNRLATQAVREALQGGTRARISPALQAILSQQSARQTTGE